MAGATGLRAASLRRSIRWLCLGLLLLAVGSTFYFIRKGFELHFMAVQIQMYSRLKWDEGKYSESVKWFIASYQSAFNAGIRWSWAQTFYLRPMATFVQQGKLHDALDSCQRAVAFLDGDDDEGVISNECVQIRDQLAGQ